MVAHDENIGRMLNKLDKLGIADDTIVMYSTAVWREADICTLCCHTPPPRFTTLGDLLPRSGNAKSTGIIVARRLRPTERPRDGSSSEVVSPYPGGDTRGEGGT